MGKSTINGPISIAHHVEKAQKSQVTVAPPVFTFTLRPGSFWGRSGLWGTTKKMGERMCPPRMFRFLSVLSSWGVVDMCIHIISYIYIYIYIVWLVVDGLLIVSGDFWKKSLKLPYRPLPKTQSTVCSCHVSKAPSATNQPQAALWPMFFPKKCCPNWTFLVGGLEHQFYFPICWEFHHPNWLSYFSEGWPNHQPASVDSALVYTQLLSESLCLIFHLPRWTHEWTSGLFNHPSWLPTCPNSTSWLRMWNRPNPQMLGIAYAKRMMWLVWKSILRPQRSSSGMLVVDQAEFIQDAEDLMSSLFMVPFELLMETSEVAGSLTYQLPKWTTQWSPCDFCAPRDLWWNFPFRRAVRS